MYYIGIIKLPDVALCPNQRNKIKLYSKQFIGLGMQNRMFLQTHEIWQKLEIAIRLLLNIRSKHRQNYKNELNKRFSLKRYPH